MAPDRRVESNGMCGLGNVGGACKAEENPVEGSPRVLDPSGRLKLRKVDPTQWLGEGGRGSGGRWVGRRVTQWMAMWVDQAATGWMSI